MQLMKFSLQKSKTSELKNGGRDISENLTNLKCKPSKSRNAFMIKFRNKYVFLEIKILNYDNFTMDLVDLC